MNEQISVEDMILPNIPLSNYALIEAVKKLKIRDFRGVFLRDELPRKPRKNECGIINLADSEASSGTHWVCYSRDGDKKTYFDSYGLVFPKELENYLGNDIEYNTLRIQHGNTVICGHLCLYILYHLKKGENFNNIIHSLLP